MVAANLSAITDGVFTSVTEVAGNLFRHANATYDIARNVTNLTREVAINLVKSPDFDVGVCGFVVSNVTEGDATTAVTSYDPAACGVYGAYPAVQPLLILLLLCFTVWSVFGNGCVIGVVLTDENLQEPGNIFLCALAFTDVALSLMFTPMAIYSLAHGEHPGGIWCRAQAFFVSFLCTLSVYLQSCLWVCRYIHIAHPLKFDDLLTRGRLALAMVLCFLVALATPLVGLARLGTVVVWSVNLGSVDIAEPMSLMTPCFPGGLGESLLSVFLCLIGMTISCCCAGLIYLEARRSQKKHDIKLAWCAQEENLAGKLKATVTLGIVVAVQWVTWLPISVAALLSLLGAMEAATAAVFADIAFLLMQTSTFSDSIVYAFRNRIYRRALEKIHVRVRRAINDFINDF